MEEKYPPEGEANGAGAKLPEWQSILARDVNLSLPDRTMKVEKSVGPAAGFRSPIDDLLPADLT